MAQHHEPLNPSTLKYGIWETRGILANIRDSKAGERLPLAKRIALNAAITNLDCIQATVGAYDAPTGNMTTMGAD